MHRFKRLLWAFILILPISEAISEVGSEVGSEETVSSQSLSDLLSSIQTLTGEFTQSLMDANGDVFENYSGSFYLAQPNKVRWVVMEPMSQEIVSDGTDLWIYDPDLEQVIIQPYNSELIASPASLFAGDAKGLGSDFDISSTGSDLQIESFVLAPKSPEALYQSLRIEFQARIPLSIEFTDALEQTTHIDLKDVVVNSTLADHLFIFEIPPNIDVVNHVD